MSPTVNISSSAEFSKILGSSTVVIADCTIPSLPVSSSSSSWPFTNIETVYADWCGPCKAIAPTYESLSTKHSKPNKVTFTKVNVDNQQDIARQYGVSA
jgi:thiol-disulfide isomerase/thioredoxin